MLIIQISISRFNLFESGKLGLGDGDSIKSFSLKYIVPDSLVKKYVSHLCEIRTSRERRKQEHNNNNAKEDKMEYTDFSWKHFFETGKVKTKRKTISEKYIKHHKLIVPGSGKVSLYNNVAAQILSSTLCWKKNHNVIKKVTVSVRIRR